MFGELGAGGLTRAMERDDSSPWKMQSERRRKVSGERAEEAAEDVLSLSAVKKTEEAKLRHSTLTMCECLLESVCL